MAVTATSAAGGGSENRGPREGEGGERKGGALMQQIYLNVPELNISGLV